MDFGVPEKKKKLNSGKVINLALKFISNEVLFMG